ncbi:MAG TPA: hypothetical protein VGM98_00460 [Schlesneria sp.]|jgi:hypothetical protein
MPRHVHPGDDVSIEAKVWNKVLDDYERDTGPSGPRSRAFRQSVTALIRNETGQDLPRYGVVGLGAPIILPSDDETEFLSKIALHGLLIDNEDLYDLRWGLTLTPIAVGEFGTVVVQGLCFAKINMSGATTAKPVTNDVTALTSADCGLARVLWSDPTGTGNRWALVCLG